MSTIHETTGTPTMCADYGPTKPIKRAMRHTDRHAAALGTGQKQKVTASPGHVLAVPILVESRQSMEKDEVKAGNGAKLRDRPAGQPAAVVRQVYGFDQNGAPHIRSAVYKMGQPASKARAIGKDKFF